MSEDMSDLMNQINQMLKNNQIPDDIKNMVNQFTNNQKSNSDVSSDTDHNASSSDTNSESTSDNSSDFTSNFDLNTMLKMKSVMDAMNVQKDDPRSNLLASLKPYLKPSRKEKVDQYMKLFSMGKVFEMLGPLGGDKKNDV